MNGRNDHSHGLHKKNLSTMAHMMLKPLDTETRSTFQDANAWPAQVLPGTVLYRYRTTTQQANGS